MVDDASQRGLHTQKKKIAHQKPLEPLDGFKNNGIKYIDIWI